VGHPLVVGQLACGTLTQRSQILLLLGELPQARMASDTEVLLLIGTRRLSGRGLGLIDVHLLASALLMRAAELFTLEKWLAQAAVIASA
jgi:hypothetical protein